jgi:murein DD-endopeptidase MepM/ murein hydrolase activator NlpD
MMRQWLLWFKQGLQAVQQRFWRPLLPRRRWRRSGRALAYGGLIVTMALGLWSVTELGLRPSPGAAVDASPVQVAAAWSTASFPVENFQAYTSPFGYRNNPFGSSQQFHYGLDLAAPMGSYIRNWWGGRVVEVSDDSSCGTSVVVESGEWLHIYCHMQGYVTRENGQRVMIDRDGGVRMVQGQTVTTGDRIGRVGMTGRTTGPHLHWGLKYQNNWVDPALVLRAMYDQQRASR